MWKKKKNFFFVCVLFCGCFIDNGTDGMERQWDPQNYEATSKWGKESAYEVIDRIDWQGNEYVLDVGTGDGKICSVIASKVPLGKVVGIDLSKDMVQHAEKSYPRELYPNLSFAVGDAVCYQTKERFDIITSFTAMHLVPDQQKALENFVILLKPVGRVILKLPIEDGFGTALEQTVQLSQWKDCFAHFDSGWFFHTKEDYERFVASAGLKLIHIEQGILDECYNSPQELADAIRQWLPHVQILSAQQQNAFLEDLLSIFLEEVPPDSMGRVHHFEPFLLVEAIKPS